MNSNYMFAFNRRPLGPPAPVAAAPVAAAPTAAAPVAAAPTAAAPVAVARSAPDAATPYGRFSINRLINYKSSGGCRSCN